jgi:hypothetical protein
MNIILGCPTVDPIFRRTEDPIVEITFGRAGFVQYLMGLCSGLISPIGVILVSLES